MQYYCLVLNVYRLKSSVLIKKGEVEGSFTSSDETPSAIASEYDKLFSRGRRDLVKATRLDDLRGKLLANLMFKVVGYYTILTDTVIEYY